MQSRLFMNKQHEKILQLDCAANLIKRDLQQLPKKEKENFLKKFPKYFEE